MVESGFPGFEATSWFALLAPKGTPKPIVDKVRAEALKVLADPEMVKKFAVIGLEPVGSTGEQTRPPSPTTSRNGRKVIKDAGIKPAQLKHGRFHAPAASARRQRSAAAARPARARCRFAVLDGSEAVAVRVGERIAVRPGAAADAAFSLASPAESWAEFAKPVPAVGFQSLVGMVSAWATCGSKATCWPSAATCCSSSSSSPPCGRSAPSNRRAAVGAPVIEPVVGRYLRLDFNGRPHRIYFEEAGQGIPLVCLHTAGADGRQYRALLNDRRDHRAASASSPSTCRGTASPRRRPASSARPTSSRPISMSTP